MAATTAVATAVIEEVPRAWSATGTVGVFATSATGPVPGIAASLRVFRARGSDTRYLLDRFGATRSGPLGRPYMRPLPETLADGVSLLSFDDDGEGALTARLVLLRRAWDLDLTLTARAVPVERVDDVYDAALDLLAAVRPMGGVS